MASRNKTTAIAIAFSVSCLLCLYAYSWTVSPRDALIRDIGQDDIGAYVRVKGYIRSVESMESGGIRVEIMDYEDLSSVTVYIPAKVLPASGHPASIRPGAFLQAAGEVQEFNGEVEISVSESGMIGILEEAENNRLGLGTLARNPEMFSGMSVDVRGRVNLISSVVDWKKLLAVAGPDKIWVDAEGLGGFGGRVDIFGEVLRNVMRNRYEIRVAGLNDSVSPHGTPPPVGYQEVALGVLAGDAASWEGRRVAVIDVNVLAGEVIGSSFELADIEDGDHYSVSCMVFGWDWARDRRGVGNGTIVGFFGVWGYYQSKAQWQVTSDSFTLRVLP